MNANKDIDRSKIERVLTHFDSDRAEAEHAIVELDSAVFSLPPVDEKGVSPCHHAEPQYAQKEEKTEKVRRLLATFREYVPAIEREMNRALNNLGGIRQASSALHTQAPREELSRGESAAQEAYRRLASQRERAVILIEKMAAAINRAGQKQWPLGKPRKATPGVIGAGSGGAAAPMQFSSPDAPVSPCLAEEIAGIRSTSDHVGSGHNGPGLHPFPRTSLVDHSVNARHQQHLSKDM